MNVTDVNTQIYIPQANEIIGKATTKICMNMVLALMAGIQEQLNFQGLAERHINPTLTKEISELDLLTSNMYQKTLATTAAHIEQNSPPLKMTLGMIATQTGIPEKASFFLQSFVLAEVKAVKASLENQQPELFQNPAIWE